MIDHINFMAAQTEEYNLDWNQLNEDEMTPLGMCIDLNLKESAKALIKLDYVRINQCYDYEQHVKSPALMCMEEGRKEIFTTLVKNPRTELHTRFRYMEENYSPFKDRGN